MQIDLKAFARKAKKMLAANEDFFKVLKRTRRGDLQEIVDKHHEAAFQKIDCKTYDSYSYLNNSISNNFPKLIPSYSKYFLI